MKVHLEYGQDGLDVDIPSSNVTVLAPKFIPGLPDEAAAFRAAVRAPINSSPLRSLIHSSERVAVVIPDITRPFPSARVLAWLFEELSHVPAERFTIINGTGSHRLNTPEELARMVGADVMHGYRVVNHNAHDPATLSPVRGSGKETGVLMNKEYVAADKRIILGFIEPHLMAGFSGGYKAVFPGLADIASIMRYHSASIIADPRSAWGLLDGNPTQALVRANGSLLPVDFCINLTLNRRRQITRFFCGETSAAHAQGCAFSKDTAMVVCKLPFPIVVTTNSGYPLDQNLYQAVKGMSAAAQIVCPSPLGGEGRRERSERGVRAFILAASKCNDGFPSHGNFRKLLFEHSSPQAILDTIMAPGFSLYDQWEAQLLALYCLKARIGLYSDIPAADVRRAHLEPVSDIRARIAEELGRIGQDAPIAVLPEGPMTIPYLA